MKCVDKMSNLMANKLELHGFYRRIDDVDMINYCFIVDEVYEKDVLLHIEEHLGESQWSAIIK